MAKLQCSPPVLAQWFRLPQQAIIQKMTSPDPLNYIMMVEFSSTVKFRDSRREKTTTMGAGFSIYNIEEMHYVVAWDKTPIGWTNKDNLVFHGWVHICRVRLSKLYEDVPCPNDPRIEMAIPMWSLHDLSHAAFQKPLETIIPKFQRPIVAVIGVPKPKLLVELLKTGTVQEIVVIGGSYTEQKLGPNTLADTSCRDLGIRYSFIKSTIDTAFESWKTVRGKDMVDETDFVMAGLTEWSVGFSKKMRRYLLAPLEKKYSCLTGPAFGSETLTPKPHFLENVKEQLGYVADMASAIPSRLSCVIVAQMNSLDEITLLKREPSSREKALQKLIKVGPNIVASTNTASLLQYRDFSIDEIRKRADRYEKDIAKLPFPHQKDLFADYGINLKTADTISRHHENWMHWIAKMDCKADALVTVGLMHGGDTQWFHNMLVGPGDLPHHFSADAGPFLTHGESGWDKVCFMAGKVQTGTTFWGPTEVTLPLIAANLIDHRLHAGLIYHDGCHTADGTMVEIEICMQMLAVGGILIVDDFEYYKDDNEMAGMHAHSGRRGMLAFEKLHGDDLERLPYYSDEHCQIAWKKKKSAVRNICTLLNPFTHAEQEQMWGSTCLDAVRYPQWYDDHNSLSGHVVTRKVWAPHGGVIGLTAGVATAGASIAETTAHGFIETAKTFESLGDSIGHDHPDTARAGFGNMVKGIGNASQVIGHGFRAVSEGTLNVFVPKEWRLW